MIAWVYGSGFPKSLDVSKAIDKAAGAKREVVGFDPIAAAKANKRPAGEMNARYRNSEAANDNGATITAPATPGAQQWEGWGTALKPALEPITLARKPFNRTVAANVLEHSTGALNVDGCRVAGEPSPSVERRKHAAPGVSVGATGWTTPARPDRYNEQRSGEFLGRWPANLIHDGSDEVNRLFPEANSARIGNPNNPHRGVNHTATSYGQGDGKETHDYRDSGSAARFFYCAKTSKRERGEGNNHPTVKPVSLMQYLCRLVTPPGGVVLDPFMGSGSTGLAAAAEGFQFVGIEREEAYMEIACTRLGVLRTATAAQTDDVTS
jgi:site-specific DNA-methyltransferase (adenine-specific)